VYYEENLLKESLTKMRKGQRAIQNDKKCLHKIVQFAYRIKLNNGGVPF
jgi:hypothetical protein